MTRAATDRGRPVDTSTSSSSSSTPTVRASTVPMRAVCRSLVSHRAAVRSVVGPAGFEPTTPAV